MKRKDLYVYNYGNAEFYLKREADPVMNGYEARIKELEDENTKLNKRITALGASEYKWFDLVRDFVTVLGNDPYMAYAAIESRLKIMCDDDELERWNKVNQSILDRLKVLTPNDWNRTYNENHSEKGFTNIE